MFSKINAWRKAITTTKKVPPKDKTDDTVNVIMSVITLTGADAMSVLEKLQERIKQTKAGPSVDEDIKDTVEVFINENPYRKQQV